MKDYYTYLLKRSDGQVFYVGRGRGNQWNYHEQKAKRGERCKLTNIIQGIWNQGQQVQKEKVQEHLSEEEAYMHQVEMHAEYSAKNPEMRYAGSYPRPVGHGKHIAEARMAKGYTPSEATRKRWSKTRTGMTYSEETKQKHREHYQYDRINSPDAVAKRTAAKVGKPRPPEVMAKLYEGYRRFLENLSEEERGEYFRPWIIAGQQAAQSVVKDTMIEQIVEETLKASGIEYVKQLQVSYYQCDFHIPSTNTIIEVNGCFAHQCPECGWNNRRTQEIRDKDARKKAFLESKGYNVQVIWEHAIEGHKVRLPKDKR